MPPLRPRFLRRWLFAQQSWQDDVGGAAVGAVVIFLVFRFAFGEPTRLSALAAAAVAVLSFLVSRLARARAVHRPQR